MQPKTQELEAPFNRLAKQWTDETVFDSVGKNTVENPAYRQIIEMGKSVLPLIFRQMEHRGGHWFRALREITVEDPVPGEIRGKVPAVQKAWLQWGRDRGYHW